MKCLFSILQSIPKCPSTEASKSKKLGLKQSQQLGIEFNLHQKKMEIRDSNLVNTLFVSIGGSFH